MNQNPRGVKMHAMMAKNEGATRDEIIGAVVLNLHHSGFATFLDCLPAAIKGFEGELIITNLYENRDSGKCSGTSLTLTVLYFKRSLALTRGTS